MPGHRKQKIIKRRRGRRDVRNKAQLRAKRKSRDAYLERLEQERDDACHIRDFALNARDEAIAREARASAQRDIIWEQSTWMLDLLSHTIERADAEMAQMQENERRYQKLWESGRYEQGLIV